MTDPPGWSEFAEPIRQAVGELSALIDLAFAEHHQQRGSRWRPSPACVSHRKRSAGSGRTEARSRISTLRSRVHTCRPGRRPKGAPSSSEHSPTRSAARSPTRFTARESLPSPRPSPGSSRRADQLAGLVAHAADQLRLGSHEPGRTFADLALVAVNLERNDHEAVARILHRITQATAATHRPTLQ